MIKDLLKEGKGIGAVEETEISRKLTIDGITKTYQVYKVRLDCLYYNDQNDRIATWISQYKADNGVEGFDISNREQYNEIIEGFIVKSNPGAIDKTQTNIELVDQREPGVVLLDGRIIDGNRRFTCLRRLAQKNDRFKYFETVILDKSIENNEKQIKMLELAIQHGEESKIDYNPIDRLVGVYNDIIEKRLLTVDEYVKSTNESEAEVNKKVELAKLMVEFLEYINAPKQFYLARDMDLNGPLVELWGILKKCKDEDKRNDIKYCTFTNFLMQPQGDMTRFIRQIKTVVDSEHIDGYLEEQLKISEKVLEKIPEVGKVTEKAINEHIRNDDDIKKKLEHSLEKAVLKAKSSESRNRPSQLIDKSIDALTAIDCNIFKKLKSEELGKIITKLDKLEEIITEVRGAINV